MADSGFVMTQEEEDIEYSDNSEEDEKEENNEVDQDFRFDIHEVHNKPWNFDEARKKLIRPNSNTVTTTIDQKIQRVMNKINIKENDHSDSKSDQIGVEDTNEEEEDPTEDLESYTRDIKEHKPKKDKQDKFFSKPPPILEPTDSFDSLHLSRPLIKAITEMGWNVPTPIQQQVIPISLAGRDIAGSAVTGSGKTAAFALPILERLLYRDTRLRTVRALILTPTRELAAQCQSVISNLAKYTNDIRCALVLGGLSLSQQAVELRTHPDIIVATPGRLIDHLLNTPSFSVEHLEILVLDEADRLLELGFRDEIEQIIKILPKARQSMLFSATMTEKVSELITLSLHRPIRVSADPLMHTSKKLIQEFIRIRKHNEYDREAMLLALCTKVFKSAVLIFLPEKQIAHRMKIIFGMAGLSASELHGNLTQLQRLDALEQFRDGKVNYLLATDIASRGLDIIGMQTVINFKMPPTESIYVHRVGRTARAGHKGRAVSLVGDSSYERNLLKQIVKHSAPNSCKHRVLPSDTIKLWKEKIEKMSTSIKEVLTLEREEKTARLAEMELDKAQNMIVHKDEIESRPARMWFIPESEKQRIKEESKKAIGEVMSDEKQEIPPEENTEKEIKEFKPPSIPSIRGPPSRREKKKIAARKDILPPDRFQLAKKKNRVKDKLKRRLSRDSSKSEPPLKKQKTSAHKKDTKDIVFRPKKKKSKKGFKSKKKHKRRK